MRLGTREIWTFSTTPSPGIYAWNCFGRSKSLVAFACNYLYANRKQTPTSEIETEINGKFERFFAVSSFLRTVRMFFLLILRFYNNYDNQAGVSAAHSWARKTSFFCMFLVIKLLSFCSKTLRFFFWWSRSAFFVQLDLISINICARRCDISRISCRTMLWQNGEANTSRTMFWKANKSRTRKWNNFSFNYVKRNSKHEVPISCSKVSWRFNKVIVKILIFEGSKFKSLQQVQRLSSNFYKISNFEFIFIFFPISGN